MDLEKIGKFIAERRRSVNLTQRQLAEKLNVTDRAVSKWENGKSLPDASIMLDLCSLLKINVSDLLKGEVVTMENCNNELENSLIEIVKQKELADKKLLAFEILIGILALIILLSFIFATMVFRMENWLKTTLIIVGFVIFLIAMIFCLRIEQTAGYYECKKCKHKHVPNFNSVLWALHFGRTRFMKCPKCNCWSWQRKRTIKD